jgi:hypothetical protein
MLRKSKAMENIERFGRAIWKTKQDRTDEKATFYRKSNAAPQNRGTHFARACAVETHLEISQEPLHTEIYKEICRATAGAP